jgi:2-C-methyl-D-erythritol 2,4-cyclodiphosphate synthase
MTTSALRVGQGFDIHPFTDDSSRRLILAGVPFDGAAGLAGHSDADAVAHALTDALLGAADLGDIGTHFSDTDPQWKGADSMRLLAAAIEMVRDAGWVVANADITVVLELPKLAPHKAEMKRNLEAVVGAPVSVKAKRGEGLGTIGRKEGIACFAVCLLTQQSEESQ